MEGKKVQQEIRKVGRTSLGIVGTVLKYIASSFALAVVYYVIFALCVDTDSEKALRRENRMYEKVYPEMLEREKLVADVITGIQAKDRKVYRDIFYADAPELAPVGSMDLIFSSDTVSTHNIIRYATRKADNLFARVGDVEADLRHVAEVYAASRDSLPPLSLPLDRISYTQTGASVGSRLNPYYKIQAEHTGLDLIASQGDAVRASADGVVSRVVHSFKGEGNVVEVTHKGGYVTRYCHLGDISVGQGQQVRRGRKIAEVGISGNSLVPHLHYEVLRDGTVLDPVQYLFASVSPDEYANMLYMSVNTGQSLD